MAETKKAKITSKSKVSGKVLKVDAKKISAPKVIAAAKRKVTAKPVAPRDNTQQKVRAEMNSLKEKATDTARDAAVRSKERASAAVSGIGKFIRDNAGTIDESAGKNYGDYARRAADAVDNFANKVDAKQVDDIVSDARDFVRKSPAVAIGAAAAIGFAISRLMRSGRDDD